MNMETMSAAERLHGGCSCGRNRYAISIPGNTLSQAEVFFSGSRDHSQFYVFSSRAIHCANQTAHGCKGHAQGAPLTAWLRVPLTWFQSQTISYYPDETHTSIRRTFTPLHAPHSQRNFCGFCGTPLTYWTESPREEAEFMSVALGSLFSDDLGLLEDLDLLPVDVAEPTGHEETTTTSQPSRSSASTAVSAPTTDSTTAVASTPLSFETHRRQGTIAGIPWFEQMIEGSQLGRIMRSRRGVGVSDDQLTTFEWEISEWQGESDVGERATSESSGAKRKVDEMASS
ncbi:hypothetical protein PISL3812_06467 [Talaromyces islandicus]|uniref:CENP-V/GFA domain-containing protein n=1 Tax=Talaromyces islandicus TaxID=28573 RepID=A0A0U1M373_TALIS|nr:hypothetical protein PISL3812_06467 [Talaromyces islandicus]